MGPLVCRPRRCAPPTCQLRKWCLSCLETETARNGTAPCLRCLSDTHDIFRGAGFDGQQWYQQLFDYGMAASVGPGDADEELVPRLVCELVLPLAHHGLRAVWNPASRRQTKAAAALIADLLVYVPTDDAKMQVGPHAASSPLFRATHAIYSCSSLMDFSCVQASEQRVSRGLHLKVRICTWPLWTVTLHNEVLKCKFFEE